MWLWLQKGSPKQRKLILRIFSVVFGIHILLLIFLFIKIGKSKFEFAIKANSSFFSVPVVFMPFQKNVPGSLKALNNAKGFSSINSRGSVNKGKVVVIQNNSKSSKSKSRNKKKALKNSFKTYKQRKISKKNKVIINEKKSKIIKNLPISQTKIESQNSNIINDETILKEKEKHDLKEINEQSLITKQNSIPENINQISSEKGALTEPIYLGRNDVEAYEIVDNIKHEISKNWRPPVGMPKNLECKIKILFDENGKVINVEVEKPSKVLVFDMSARKAASQIEVPKAVWGHEISLVFSQ